jgi:hypothetical protein
MEKVVYKIQNFVYKIEEVEWKKSMVDPLQFAAIAGCKTKPVEEFSVRLP